MWVDLNPGTIGLAVDDDAALVRLAAKHGFGGCDLHRSALADLRAAEAARERRRSAGLRCGLFGLPADMLRIEDGDFDAALAATVELAPIAAAAGCTRTYNHVWPGSDEREFAANWRWHRDRIARLRDVLAPHGIVLGLEFIGPLTLQRSFAHPFLRRIDEAAALAREVGDGVGIVIDLFHWHCSGGTVEDLRRECVDLPVVNVHANDARADRAPEEQRDAERAMPLETGVIDARGAIVALRELAYDGPVICEPFRPAKDRLAALDPDDACAEVVATMRRLLSERPTPSDGVA